MIGDACCGIVFVYRFGAKQADAALAGGTLGGGLGRVGWIWCDCLADELATRTVNALVRVGGEFQLEFSVQLQQSVVDVGRVHLEVDGLTVHLRRVAILGLCDSADCSVEAGPARPHAVDGCCVLLGRVKVDVL